MRASTTIVTFRFRRSTCRVRDSFQGGEHMARRDVNLGPEAGLEAGACAALLYWSLSKVSSFENCQLNVALPVRPPFQ
jgi:hypothetical protein